MSTFFGYSIAPLNLKYFYEKIYICFMTVIEKSKDNEVKMYIRNKKLVQTCTLHMSRVFFRNLQQRVQYVRISKRAVIFFVGDILFVPNTTD